MPHRGAGAHRGAVRASVTSPALTINSQLTTQVYGASCDGFVIPLPKKNLNAYRRMAQKAGKIWRGHGALEFRECVGDDLDIKMGKPFTRRIKTKPGETVLFSYIVFKSRADRDRVNARVMKDLRIAKMMGSKLCPSMRSACSTADSRPSLKPERLGIPSTRECNPCFPEPIDPVRVRDRPSQAKWPC